MSIRSWSGLAAVAAIALATSLLTAQTPRTHIQSGSSLPTNCTVGDLYLLTSGSAGLYSCLATDAWAGTSAALSQPYNLTFVIDGGGSVITTGFKGCTSAAMAGTIIAATTLSTDAAVTSGSIVVDVWEDTLNNYPPTDADSITAAAPPTLASATNAYDATLTGWSTSLVNGGAAATTSVLCFHVDSVSSLTRATVVLRVQP